MNTFDVIDFLAGAGWSLTMHDIGADNPVMCLAVKTADVTDLYYLGMDMKKYLMNPNFIGSQSSIFFAQGFAYFPGYLIDEKAYARLMCLK
jgi:hypothetical protein